MTAVSFPTPKYEDYRQALGALDDDGRLALLLEIGHSQSEDERADIRRDGAEMSGCQARVWIAVGAAGDKSLWFRATSDAAIVTGLATIMAESFSGLSSSALRGVNVDAVRAFPLGAMTTHRQIGMMAMLKHMQKMRPAA